jgi:thiol-disulfide isomerase/thioredoxin
MFRGPDDGVATPPRGITPATSRAQASSSILQDVASNTASLALSAAPTLTGRIHASTNPSSFHSMLNTHRAVIAFFTSASCAPCRVIEPVFENLAVEKGVRSGVSFTKIDMGVGRGVDVAREYSVRVTPTFIFFLDGQKVSFWFAVRGF